MEHPLLTLVVFLAIALALGLISLVAYTCRALTHPARHGFASALARGRPCDPSELPPSPAGPWVWREWSFRGADFDHAVWDITGLDTRGPTIILTHGWAGSRLGALARVPYLAPLASRLILWNMRGHGDTPGACTLGVREPDDLLALVARLRESEQSRIILHGWSLGAGVSIVAAAKARDSVIGVVAENPYRQVATPARNMLARGGLPSFPNLPLALAILGSRMGIGGGWQDFDRAEWATRLTVPLLVLHAELDTISPPEDGRAIAAAAPHARFMLVPGAAHHGMWTTSAAVEAMTDEYRGFLAALGPIRA